MTLDPQLHEYPLRRYGMDHDRYNWSLLQKRTPIRWPAGKTIALWINISVEVFPLDDDGKPFKLPGSMKKPYPDVQYYTWRDYGNRVGIYRVMDALDDAGVRSTWSVNGVVAKKYPALLRDIVARSEEIIAHGYDMASPHYGGMDEAVETELIAETLDLLGQACDGKIRGWLSPGKSQSTMTPELLAKAGIEYLCDWPNDELPYPVPSHGGLGIHLSLDLAGCARFGPDVQWVDHEDYALEESRREAFEEEIRRYWPGLPSGALQPAYSGIRPKLNGPGEVSADFRIDGPKHHGIKGLVNLFGIESPGLTASLAIAGYVRMLLADEVD